MAAYYPPVAVVMVVEVRQLSGPQVDDPEHVRAWISLDGVDVRYGHRFEFLVCPTHARPAECECRLEAGHLDTTATFRLVDLTADQPAMV